MHKKQTNSTIAISLGDPSGISPEVVAANLPIAVEYCRPILFGHWPSIEKALEKVSALVRVELVQTPRPAEHGTVAVVHCGPDGNSIDQPGEEAAIAQFEALERAVDYCLSSDCEALVTAPVSKDLVASVSPGFTGHTEYLAHRAGLKPDDVTMVFASETLAVGLVSTHVPICQVAASLTRPRVERTIRHVSALLNQIKKGAPPRIGVAALNPHAGENGLFGKEEEEILKPICDKLSKSKDIDLVGPLPADSLFRDALRGRYDGIVSTYHDQAMIPLKLMGVGQTVNVTMGLPFCRTSPDHGVAYDIARKGIAEPSGMKSALDLAVVLVAKKSE